MALGMMTTTPATTKHWRKKMSKLLACVRSFINFIARFMKYLLHLFIFKLFCLNLFFICIGHSHAFTLVCVCVCVCMGVEVKNHKITCCCKFSLFRQQCLTLFLCLMLPYRFYIFAFQNHPKNIYSECIAYFSLNRFKSLLLFLFRRASNRFLSDLFSIPCDTKCEREREKRWR